jgi:phosphoketolase
MVVALFCGICQLRESGMPNVLSDAERSLIDAYWRAANYLSVGQIYLYDNLLLKAPLSKEHIKPRLLGHWERRRASISSTST